MFQYHPLFNFFFFFLFEPTNYKIKRNLPTLARFGPCFPSHNVGEVNSYSFWKHGIFEQEFRTFDLSACTIPNQSSYTKVVDSRQRLVTSVFTPSRSHYNVYVPRKCYKDTSDSHLVPEGNFNFIN